MQKCSIQPAISNPRDWESLRSYYDGRFSGGSSGLAYAYLARAAEGGALALVEEGDSIEIDIPRRVIRVSVPDEELAKRRKSMETKGLAAWKPLARDRKVSKALQAYAALATSAARGAVRDVTQIQK